MNIGKRGRAAAAGRIFLAALLCLLPLCACGSADARTAAGPGTDLNIYCFSAGKADAFLLYTERSAVLIDCGEKGFGREILAYMEEAGIGSLDYMIITHFDKDHVGGAARILNSVPVGAVLQSNHPKSSGEYEKYAKALGNASLEAVTVRKAMTFALDGVSYAVDPPRKDDYRSDGSNNSSLIVSVKNGENDLLFTGDAQDERILEFAAQNNAAYEFLKVPYHGRWQDALPELVASVRPSLAVITSSDEEPEDAETLDLLAQAGAETYLTRQGAILFHSDGTALWREAFPAAA